MSCRIAKVYSKKFRRTQQFWLKNILYKYFCTTYRKYLPLYFHLGSLAVDKSLKWLFEHGDVASRWAWYQQLGPCTSYWLDHFACTPMFDRLLKLRQSCAHLWNVSERLGLTKITCAWCYIQYVYKTHWTSVTLKSVTWVKPCLTAWFRETVSFVVKWFVVTIWKVGLWTAKTG